LETIMRPCFSVLLLAAAPLAAQPAPQAMTVQAAPATPLPGYVADRPLLSLLRLLPPPPDAGSSEAKADHYLYRDSRRGIGGPEWRKAQGQLGIGSAEYQKAVACAVGATINYKATPATMTLLIRAGADLSRAVTAAKDHYKRPRPFTTDRGKACDPESAVDGGKRLGFAYPSGHAGVGWLWGLILADVRAERSAEVLKFGKATGDLRIACRVHWASDVTGGRLLATALYQQIADAADYKADLLKAKAELTLAPVPEGCPAT
jgi:acid phosphatase (class A)